MGVMTGWYAKRTDGRGWWTRLVCAAVACGMTASMAAASVPSQARADAGDSVSGITNGMPVVITELAVKTSNGSYNDDSGKAQYVNIGEFIELTNVSDKALPVGDLSLGYVAGSSTTDWTPEAFATAPDVKIPAKESVVLWSNYANASRGDVTPHLTDAADFNAYWKEKSGTDPKLVDNTTLFTIGKGSGMANSSARSLVLTQKSTGATNTVTYDDGGATNDKTLNYAYAADGSWTLSKENTGTPGTLVDGQIPNSWPAQSGNTQLTVADASNVAKPVGDTDALKLAATASVSGEDSVASVTLWVKTNVDKDFTLSSIQGVQSDGVWTFSLPAGTFTGKTSASYYFEAKSAGGVTAKSDQATVTFTAADPSLYKAASTPLVVTEVAPDTANVGGADGYEFIEIHNVSDKAVDFSDNYTIYYYYPASGDSADVQWDPVQTNLSIAAHGTLVLWVRNGPNNDLTADDFNKAYGLTGDHALVEGVTLADIDSAGMSNSAARGIKITTRTKTLLNLALYPDNATALTGDSHSFQYVYDGSTNTSAVASVDAAPTPGQVDEATTIRATPYVFATPAAAPSINDHSPSSFTSAKDLTLSFDAASEGGSLTRASLFITVAGEKEYTRHDLLTVTGSDTYSYTMSNIDLLRKASVTYYIEASDGVNAPKATKAVTINNTAYNIDPVRLNVADGDILAKSTPIRATADGVSDAPQLSIDGKAVATSELSPSLESEPYIAADITQTDMFFYNSFTRTPVVTGTPQQSDWKKNVLGVFDDGTYGAHQTVAYKVPLDMITHDNGDGTVSLYLNSGTKSSATDLLDAEGNVNSENADNYLASKIRLVLADGTELKVSKATAAVSPGTSGTVSEKDVTGEVADSSKSLKIGDSAGQYENIKLDFTIPDTQFGSRQYVWDTTGVADGTHAIHDTAGSQETAASVVVDNTAPTIDPTVADGSTQRGDFTIDAKAADATSGIPAAGSEGALTATLSNGSGEQAAAEAISLPYATSSATLPAGAHTVTFTVADKAGNQTVKAVTFTTPDEKPDATVHNSDTAAGKDPTLTVKATDSSKDPLTVTFKRGESYTPADQAKVTATQGESGTAGVSSDASSTSIGTKDAEGLAKAGDGKSLSTTGVSGGFPYHRFEVAIPAYIQQDPSASTTVRWSGSASPQSFVYAYVKNTSTGAWDEVSRVETAADGAAKIEQKVENKDHVRDGKMTVVVQNETGYASLASGGQSSSSDATAAAADQPEIITPTSGAIAQEDAPRGDYDFTFAWESDTQYYNANYDNDGYYQHQMDINNWILANRQKMNIQYVFHTGDVVDDSTIPMQWTNADAAYKLFDDAKMPYGVLAGNHDVDQKTEDYNEFGTFFGENRYKSNPWYGGSFDNNRGHYDLVSAGGKDFIMVYMGWGVGQEQIDWVNKVLKQYPNRIAILDFHEYLLASGGLGLIPQEIYDQVVTKNTNVRMVMSGHYHSAQKTISQIDDDGDGKPDRNVVNMLFDYQGMKNGGMGYLRLMHVNTQKGTMLVRTYSPSLKQYGSQGVETSTFTPQDEEFTIDLTQLGIPASGSTPQMKTLTTDAVSFDELSEQKIGEATTNPATGTDAVSVVWKNAPAGRNGWYATITNQFGGSVDTPVTYTNTVTDNGSGGNGGSDGGTGEGGGHSSPTDNNGNQGSGSSHASQRSPLASTGSVILPVGAVAAALILSGLALALAAKKRGGESNK